MPDPFTHPPLDGECETLTRLLTGASPDAYVVRKYRDAHRATPFLNAGSRDPVDDALLRAAWGGGAWARAADAYARFFRPRTALRLKLVLLVALLENSPRTCERLDSAEEGSTLPTLLRIAGRVALGAGLLGMGMLRFGPRHLLARVRDPAPLGTVEAA